MKLVVGGYASGKKTFAMEKWNYNESQFSKELDTDTKVLFDLQDLDCSCASEMMPRLLKKEVVICNEMGCGIVPIEREQREQREFVGRLCIKLAQEAEEVYRVYVGIGTKIK